MSLYVIGDLHLSLGVPSKSMDVFKGWEDYTIRLKKNWEMMIRETDTVVIAGDISWAMRLEETKQDFDFLNKLPGKKVFIKGNHDYWWGTKNKVEKFLIENEYDTISILYNSAIIVKEFCICGTRGFLEERGISNDDKLKKREASRLKTSIDIAKDLGKEPIVFLHYPPIYMGNTCKEIMDVLIDEKIKRCFYGHLHGRDAHERAVNGIYKHIDFQLISSDYLNFIPYFVI